MNFLDHPLNQAALERSKREKIDLPPQGVPIFRLAAHFLDLSSEGDEPEAIRLANAERPRVLSNGLALLEQAGITPELVKTYSGRTLGELILDAITPAPCREPEIPLTSG